MEKTIQNEILAKINSLRDCRVFRNNVGMGFAGTVLAEHDGIVVLKNYRRIQFGLQKGSGDLIGFKSMTITPDTVGKKVAVFTSFEIKTPRSKSTGAQRAWLFFINHMGGIAAEVHSVDEAKRALL